MIIIKPLGDRILVKLRRSDEVEVGGVKLTLAHSDKKRYQPESAVFMVVEVGTDVPDSLKPGDFVLARSDAGITLPPGSTNADNHRTYRLMEFPEIWARVEENKLIATAEQVLPEKVVI